MVRMAAILAAVAAFVYVAVVGVQWLTPRIEQDVQARVATALAEKGLMWADLKVEGRKVILGGEAPDAATRDQALSSAARVFGVAMVEDRIQLPGDLSVSATTLAAKADKKAEKAELKAEAQQPYALTITKQGDAVKLSGQVPDEQTKEVLVRIGQTHYGAGKVTADLTVAKGAPAGWRSAAGTVLFNIVNLETANVTLSGTEVMLEGEVLDADYASKAEDSIKKALPSAYKVGFAVNVITPTEAAAKAAPADEAAKLAAAEDAKLAAIEPAAGPAKAEPKAEKVAAPVAAKAEAPKAEVPQAPVTDAATQAVAAATALQAAKAPAEVCAAVEKVRKERIFFAFDKADLKPKYEPVIARVADLVKACNTAKVTVAGYTDGTGSKLYNKWLSEQRAETAVRALIRQGVEKESLRAVGYGERKPTASNKTRKGRALNRRVEFHPGAEFESGAKMPKLRLAEETTPAVAAPAKAEKAGSKSWWNSLGTLLNKGSEATPPAAK